MYAKPEAAPGVHPDRHRPHRLHPWVLAQRQVWVDAWGTEHEIELMPGDYVQNVVRFCRRRAGQLYNLCAVASSPQIWEMLLEGRVGPAQHLIAQLEPERLWEDEAEEAGPWLEETPLIATLRSRLKELGLEELPIEDDTDDEELDL